MKAPIVGIGASAGGLEAISELLAGFSARPGAAIIIVQHLDRSHDSLLPEILRRRTSMPVVAAAHGEAVLTDHVYVIPPNVTLTVAGGLMQLSPRASGREIHKPVDALFRSLADDCGDSAIGVVLSGADSDGALGIEDIKRAGGITFAQSPDTARVPSMPQAAMNTGYVDSVLPPPAIAAEIQRLIAHPYLHRVRTTAPPPESPDVDESIAPDEGEMLRRVFRKLRAVHGVDFARYKSSTLRRRLARRMALQRIDSLAEYTELLETDTAEAAALYQDFLIRVTSFFRDPDSYRVLSEQVFPSLIAGRPAKEPIRVWVPGCATGEEVYSIAISLLEATRETAPALAIQIFGTDVSETAIEKSRAGTYLEAIVQDVPPDLLRRYFVKQDSHYVIARAVRDLCVFARHDITRDPPYSRLDLVSCRNLLVYLGAVAQTRVMQMFRYALRPQGYLQLGPSEGVGHGEELFEPVDKQHRVYRPRPASKAAAPPFAMNREGVVPAIGTLPSGDRGARDFVEDDAVQRRADRLLLARYSPASMLVDDALNILQFRGHTAPYLAPAHGTPSLNLTRIARPELLVVVPPLLQESRESGRAARRTGVVMEELGEIDVEVIPINQLGGANCFLILLEDDPKRASRRDRRGPAEALPESEKDQRIAQVERENQDLREFLQATMEQHEAAKEELKSAHEEVLSANEEFQSTNEELETSKEELQSANEELTTTNEELRERNRLLGVLNKDLDKARVGAERARAYADVIVETVREPLVVLDGGLKVLRVNKAYCTEFETRREQVEGRSLEVVSGGLWGSPLREKLSEILAQGVAVTDFEMPFTHPLNGKRLLSLNARRIVGDAERGELILLAIDDVTESRNRSDALSEGNRRKDEFLAMLAHELRNPLGAISHAIHVLKIGALENAPRMHEMIERQTAHLVRLVNDLLDVARISRGLIELQRQPVDLARIVRQSVEAARGKLELHGHVLSISVPDFPVCVEGDPVRLEQVISNLLENSIKYTEPGGQLNISLMEQGGEGVLQMSDNGIGIAADSIGRVFDLFTQVGPPSHSGGGLGLGLTVVRRVLELHGGRIEAQSAGLGRGSEFIVRLPLIPASSLRRQAEASGSASVAAPASAVEARRVLIVDDNVDSGETLAMVLAHWGHEVHIADSGEAALRALDAFAAEVAFIDIGLPDISGYELAARVRQKTTPRQIRLVALTGYGTAADRKRAKDAGFDEHVVKPADPDRLAQLLSGPVS